MYEKNQLDDRRMTAEIPRGEQISSMLEEQQKHLYEISMRADGILLKLRGPEPQTEEKTCQPDSVLQHIRQVRGQTCILAGKIAEIDKLI